MMADALVDVGRAEAVASLDSADAREPAGPDLAVASMDSFPDVPDVSMVADVAVEIAVVLDSPLADVPLGIDAEAWDTALPSEASNDDNQFCPEKLQQPVVTSTGSVQGAWRFVWSDGFLAQRCASYGPDARMVVELNLYDGPVNHATDIPACSDDQMRLGSNTACTTAGSFRYEAACTTGTLDFLAPSAGSGSAHVHVESTRYPNPPRQIADWAVGCPRRLAIDHVPPPPADGDLSDARCRMYPGGGRVDADSKTLWWSHFRWQQADLASVCASYGPNAKMVLEVGSSTSTLPDCSNAELMVGGDRACVRPGSGRFEADCTAGEMLFESDASALQYGYYHVESAQRPSSGRRSVGVDATCSRDAYPKTGPVLSPTDLAVWPRDGKAVDAGAPITAETRAEPAANGQPCRLDSDCSIGSQICFIDAPTTACPDQPIGRCIPYFASHCLMLGGCACATFFAPACKSEPGMTCARFQQCAGCVPQASARRQPD